MTPAAYMYICDGDIDHPVLTYTKMDWPEKYPHWQEIPLVMAQRKLVAWQWKNTMNFRKTPPPGAEPGIWRPVYSEDL